MDGSCRVALRQSVASLCLDRVPDLVLIVLVVYPLAMLILGALTTTNPALEGLSSVLTLQNFQEVLGNEQVRTAAVNSLISCGLGTFFAVIIGVGLSWIVARTDTPMRGWVETASIMPLFMPPLVAAVAWSYVGSPTTGLINMFIKELGWDFRLNMYSMTGMVAVFAMYYAPYVYMFVSAALKNMDPALEEAAQMSGAGPVRTMLTITLPLVAPAILSGSLLAFVVMFGIYGIPAALGTPARIDVLTTYLFKLTSWTPPLFNTAAAVAIIMVVVTTICVGVQAWALSGRSFVTVTGKSFKPRTLKLGPWRWVTFGLACLYALVAVVLPCIGLLVAAFRKFLFVPNLASLFDTSQYSLGHFNNLFESALVWRSFWNTIEVGIMSAVVGGLLAFAISYTIHRTNLPFRRTLDMMGTAPVAIPGLVIGVAYLWAWVAFSGFLWGTTLDHRAGTRRPFPARYAEGARRIADADPSRARGSVEDLRHRNAADDPSHYRATDIAGSHLGNEPAVYSLDPRTRLVALPLHQHHDRDAGAAARLPRRWPHRCDRGIQRLSGCAAARHRRRRQLARAHDNGAVDAAA